MPTQTILCEDCSRPYGQRTDFVKKMRKAVVQRGRCEQCKLVLRKKNALMLRRRNRSRKMRDAARRHMTNNNPMHDRETAQKVATTVRERYRRGEVSSFCDAEVKKRAEQNSRKFWTSSKSSGIRKKFSKRMSTKNPMYDHNTAKMVGEIRKQKIRSGEFIPRRGEYHWNWKGKRRFNLFVRSRLYKPWIRPVMERDNFACTKCGRTRCNLHVHHTRRLEEIINLVLSRHGITDIVKVQRSDSTLYSALADEVVTEHRLSDGTTLCKACHAQVDKRYHP